MKEVMPVSLLALAGDTRLIAAYEVAVEKALAWIEQNQENQEDGQ